MNYFPIPLRLSADALESFKPGRYAKGSKLRAMQDGQSLPIEVETWNPEGESVVWVGVPVVTNGATFSLLAAPRTGSVLPDARPERVWTRAGYVGVWHLSATNAVGVFEDSSGVFGPTRDVFGGVFTNGVVGGGVLANHKMIVAGETATSHTFPDGITSEMWIVPTAYAGHGRPFSSMADGTGGYGWSVRVEDYYEPAISGTAWSNASSRRGWRKSDATAPRHLSSSEGTKHLLFEDGVQKSSWNLSSYASPSFANGIGLMSYVNGNYCMVGLADELRIRDCESDAAWHRANFLAMNPDVPYLGVELARDFPPATMILIY